MQGMYCMQGMHCMRSHLAKKKKNLTRVCKKLRQNQTAVGQVVTRSSLERKVWGANLRQVKSDTVFPTACHHCDICSKGAVLPGRNDVDMGPANSLHALW